MIGVNSSGTGSRGAANAILLFLLLLIYEGAIRKWVSQDVGNGLIILRDILAFYVIYVALKTSSLKRIAPFLEISVCWSAIVVVWALVQLMLNQTSPIVCLIGLRFWLLYFWFALAVASQLDRDIFTQVNLLLIYGLLSMVPLVIIQHFSSPSSWVNFQLDTDEANIFRVAGDVVRTSGTFSFTLGYTCFLALCAPAVFWLLDDRKSLTPRSLLGGLGFVGLMVATVVSGSRAAVVYFLCITALRYLLLLFRSHNAGNGRYLAVEIGVVVVVGFAVIASLGSAIEATTTRFQEASDSEEFDQRVLTIFFGEPEVRKSFSLLGSGVGAATNGNAVRTTGDRAFLLAESEPGRVALEGGAIGYIFTLGKLSLVLVGLSLALRRYRQIGVLSPVLIWITAGVGLLSWPISGQVSAHGFGYFLLAMALGSVACNV